MKKTNELLKKLLTITLTVVMVFSSILVVNTNTALAEMNEEPEVTEVEQTELSEEEKAAIAEAEKVKQAEAENQNASAEAADEETTVNTEEENKKEEETKESQAPLTLGTQAPMMKMTSSPKLGGSILKALFGRKSTTYSVTFIVDNKEYKVSNFNYEEIEEGSSIPKPTNPTKEGYTFKGWFIRVKDDLLGLIKSEVRFNFNDDELAGDPNTINKNVVLYAKFEKESKADLYYNFRVKHIGSYGKTVDEFLAEGNNTGENIIKDGDYIYSFYSYYKQSEYQTILRDFVNLLQGTGNFEKTWVIDYNYQMYEDQFVYAVVENISDIDSNGNGKVTNFSDEKYIGCSYTQIGTEALYNDQGEKVTDNGILVKIGDYYTGTAFDLAIQDANEGDVIELLDNLYVTKPVEIWANVNLDLNGKTILYNENSVGLDLLHFIDRKTRKSDIIIPKDITSTILVTNANVTISNGTIRNTSSKGRGIIDVSFDEDYKLRLENVEVIVDGSSNTNNYAVQAGYDLIDESGVVVNKSSGYIDVISGKYHGYFLNTNDGRLTIYHDARMKYDPRYMKNSTTDSGVTFEEHYQIYNDGDANYPWVVSVEAEAVVIDGNTEVKEYRTLLEAVQDTAVNNECTIRLLKDINLNKVSYATNGEVTFDGNSYYQLDLNGHTIYGNSINITNGTTWIIGNGFVKANIHVKESGNLVVDSGSYYSIFDDTEPERNGAIQLRGGSYIDNIPSTFYLAEYECLYNDVPVYKYSIVKISDGDPISLSYINGSSETITNSFKQMSDAIDCIETIDGTDIAVTLNADIQTTAIVEITKGLTLNLNGHKIISKAGYNQAECIGITSVYVNIDDDTNDILNIINGTISNNSLAEDSDEVCVLYIDQGNVNITNTELVTSTSKCSNGYVIYNAEKNTGKVNISASNISLVGKNVKAYDSVETIYNGGEMKIENGSNVFAGNSCGDITAIYNNGDIEIVDSHIDADGASAKSASVYGINSSGNIHFYETNGSAEIIANNKSGKTYGIYQRYAKDTGIKKIEIENGADIRVTADNGVENGTVIYGIYTAKSSSYNCRTDILLGKCNFYISTPHNKAVGIYAAGGYIYSGTVNNGQLSTGMYDKVDDNLNPVNLHDNIYADEFDNFAIFEIKGADQSIGIDCEYGTKEKVANQLTNPIIRMNCTGDDVYCVKANGAIIGTDIISGYFYSTEDNRMMSGRVFCKGGYYNRDVSLNASSNNKCVPTEETDAKRHLEYEFNENPYNHNYEYTIEGSNCVLTVSAKTTDELALKIMIEYDPAMLAEKNKYGVKISVGDKVDGSEPIDSIAITIAAYEAKEECTISNGRYVYNFPLPIKAISNNIRVEIVSFDENGIDNHTYHLKKTFSIEQYFYDLLDDKNERTETVRDFAVASLNMGASAQNYFEYWLNNNPSNVANKKVGNYYDNENSTGQVIKYSPKVTQNSQLVNENPHKNGKEEYEEAIDYKGHSLELGGKTSLKFYYSLKEINGVSYTNSDYTFTSKHYDEKGNLVSSKVLTPKTSNDGDYIEIENISMFDIKNDFIIEIHNNKTGKDYRVSYSPIDYIIYTTLGKYLENITDQNELKKAQELVTLMNAYYECYIQSLSFRD